MQKAKVSVAGLSSQVRDRAKQVSLSEERVEADPRLTSRNLPVVCVGQGFSPLLLSVLTT